MKKFILSLSAIAFLCNGLIAQQTISRKAISYLPYEASDFLILDTENNPTVSRWEVEIQELIQDAIGNFIYTTVESRLLSNTSYYTKIESRYKGGGYYIKVSGWSSNGIIIVQEGPVPICPGCPTDGESCTVTCVSNTYAWSADYFDNSASPLSLTLSTAKNPITNQPYYQYFSPVQFSQLNTNDYNYYGVNSWTVGQGGKVITHNATLYPVSDAQGNQLSGTVYGVQKYLGPWAGNSVVQATNIAGDIDVLCGQGVTTAISIINNNSATSWLTPNLACSGTGITVPHGATPETSADFFEIDCEELVIGYAVDENGNILYEIIELFDCEEGTQPGFNWPSEVAVVNILPYINPTGGQTTIYKEDIFKPNGEIIAPPIHLEKGLYTIGVQFVDGSYTTFFFESKEESTQIIELASLLNPSVFPVPIVGNEFNLRLESFAKLKFDYFLYDGQGNELYNKKFNVNKDDVQTKRIKINSGIPNGILINRFVFEDGSVITFQTYK